MITRLDENMELLLLDYINGNLAGTSKLMVKASLQMRDDIHETYCLVRQLAGYALEEMPPVQPARHVSMLDEIMQLPAKPGKGAEKAETRSGFKLDYNDAFPPVVQHCFECTSKTMEWQHYAPGIAVRHSSIDGLESLKLWCIAPSFSLSRIAEGKTACLVLQGDLWACAEGEADHLLVYGDICIADQEKLVRYSSGDEGQTIILSSETPLGLFAAIDRICSGTA